MRLISHGGVLTDHRGAQIVAGPDDAVFQDDDGRIVVQRNANPHALLRTVWTAQKGEDVPDVVVTGVQLRNEAVELVIAPVDFSADFTDHLGEPAGVARAIDLDDLLAYWKRADEAQAEDTISSVLEQLGRLG